MDIPIAIRSRRLISFTYDGLPRVVQPATYGYTTAGNLAVRGVLIRGESRRNMLPCWELFKESKMAGFDMLDETFEDFAKPGYTLGDSGFSQILEEH